MEFNWQESDRDSFIHWFLPLVLSSVSDEVMKEAGERSNGFRNVVVGVTINGVEVDASKFLDAVHDNMKHYASQYAKEAVSNTVNEIFDVDALYDLSESLKRAVKNELNRIGIYTMEGE